MENATDNAADDGDGGKQRRRNHDAVPARGMAEGRLAICGNNRLSVSPALLFLRSRPEERVQFPQRQAARVLRRGRDTG